MIDEYQIEYLRGLNDGKAQGHSEAIAEVLKWCEENKEMTDIGDDEHVCIIEYVPLQFIKARFGEGGDNESISG